jgi:hypothetical protein
MMDERRIWDDEEGEGKEERERKECVWPWVEATLIYVY